MRWRSYRPGGCWPDDFLKLNGIRSDVVWDAVKDIVQTKPKLVQKMHHVWTLLSTSTPEEQSESELTAAIKAMVRGRRSAVDLPRMAGDLVGQAGGDGGL